MLGESGRNTRGYAGERVPKIVAGAHNYAEGAEASVEAVVDPSAILLERIGVHLGEGARATAPTAQDAIDGLASIRPARLHPRESQ